MAGAPSANMRNSPPAVNAIRSASGTRCRIWLFCIEATRTSRPSASREGRLEVRFDSVPVRVAQTTCGLLVVPANQRLCSW